MSPGILAATYSILVLVEKGLTIADVLREVKATGRVPPEQWDQLDAEFADAAAFWGAAAERAERADPNEQG